MIVMMIGDNDAHPSPLLVHEEEVGGHGPLGCVRVLLLLLLLLLLGGPSLAGLGGSLL